jgi:Macrocin-O-methyltransferase (TylF)
VLEVKLTSIEARHRLSQPRWVASQTYRYIREAVASISPSRFASLYRRIKPLTMCSYARLLALHRSVLYLEANQIPGDIVECGVAHGGSAAMMALTLGKQTRRLWLFDTFEGLPAPTEADPDRHIASLYTGAFRASVEEVQSSFQKLGIAHAATIVPGLFQDTLPQWGTRAIALLHVDGDWYESVRATLDNLYDHVSPGGIIQLDDYGHWAGARRAVDEFMKSRHIKQALRYIDFSGRQLIKR